MSGAVRQRVWTEDDDEFLRRNAAWATQRLADYYGVTRKCVLARMRALGIEKPARDDAFTTEDVAAIFGWTIEKTHGYILRGTLETHPGGGILPDAIRRFVLRCLPEVSLSAIERAGGKEVFVDLLARPRSGEFGTPGDRPEWHGSTQEDDDDA